MDTRFRPALQSFEERLAPAVLVASKAIGGTCYMCVGVVLPPTVPPTPPVPTVPPPPPPPPPPAPGSM